MKKTLLLAFLCAGLVSFAADDYKSLIDAAKKADAAKKSDQAIELYVKASQCAAKPGDQLYAIQKAARLLNHAKKKAESRKMLLAFAENQNNPKMNRLMAYLDCVRTTEDTVEKIKFLDAGIALDAGDWPEAACYNGKGDIYFSQKKYTEAAAEYKKVAETEAYPVISRTISYEGLARVAIQLKNYSEAHRCYQCIQEFNKKKGKSASLDVLKGEAAIYYLEGKYAEGNALNLEIVKNTKFSVREREKAFAELIETEYNRRNDPVAAKKMLEETADLGLKASYRVEKAARDIKLLFDEE